MRQVNNKRINSNTYAAAIPTKQLTLRVKATADAHYGLDTYYECYGTAP